jgi:hypothetical protein
MFDSNLVQNVFFYQTGGSNILLIEGPLVDVYAARDPTSGPKPIFFLARTISTAGCSGLCAHVGPA